MKLRSLILGICLSLCTSVFAANNQHLHPQANNTDNQPATNGSVAKNLKYPGYCEIEIINRSFSNVSVYGTFDDGTSLQPFDIYSFESPHYISLYYYGYCHYGMNIYINTFGGSYVYSGYTPVGTTIRVVPYLANQLKAEISKK
jgi:hypothetical protein